MDGICVWLTGLSVESVCGPSLHFVWHVFGVWVVGRAPGGGAALENSFVPTKTPRVGKTASLDDVNKALYIFMTDALNASASHVSEGGPEKPNTFCVSPANLDQFPNDPTEVILA